MLKITIPSVELFNEKTNEFIYTREQELQLEHSLVSLSRWESKWCKPFLSHENKTPEETLDYIRAMTITQNVDPAVYSYIPQSIIDQIFEYIHAPMTATTFSTETSKPSKEVVTSEVIYYSMVAYNIPFECQRWHLNRLITLIKICNIQNQPKKKRSQADILREQAKLNELRKSKLGTSG